MLLCKTTLFSIVYSSLTHIIPNFFLLQSYTVFIPNATACVTLSVILNLRHHAEQWKKMEALWSNAASVWEHIACTFSSPDVASQSVFLCHCCKSDVSFQCTPPVDHHSTQTGNAPSICNCSCALEVSQLKQEVLDMKVQMKNLLKIIYNAVM